MAAREFLSLQIIDVTEAAVETAIENTEKGQGLEIIPIFNGGVTQLAIIAYVNT